MIPFFRKIRNLPAGKAGKMADDNRPLKYMRYAFGEIVLVVIGILVALQVNNWNQQKKLDSEEEKILKSLSSELEDNLIKFDSIYNYHMVRDSVLNRFRSKKRKF